MDDEERAAFERAERAQSDAVYELKQQQWAKVDEAFANGQRVVLDLSYSERMSDKERRSLARQLSPCWGAIKRASAPVSLHIAGLGGCPIECLPKGGSEMGAWKVHQHQQNVEEVFSRDELVFLSPDAEEPLEAPLDRANVYVIGGFVDGTIQKNVTRHRAEAIGARARRLPLEEHAPQGISNPRLPLTINSVLEILLALNAGEPWDRALGGAVAPRHQLPGHRSGRKARRAERREAAAAAANTTDEGEHQIDRGGGSMESKGPSDSSEQQAAQTSATMPAATTLKLRPGQRRRKERIAGHDESGDESEEQHDRPAA